MFVKALTYTHTHTHKEVGFVIIAVRFYFCNMQTFLRVNKFISIASVLLPSPAVCMEKRRVWGVGAECCRCFVDMLWAPDAFRSRRVGSIPCALQQIPPALKLLSSWSETSSSQRLPVFPHRNQGRGFPMPHHSPYEKTTFCFSIAVHYLLSAQLGIRGASPVRMHPSHRINLLQAAIRSH